MEAAAAAAAAEAESLARVLLMLQHSYQCCLPLPVRSGYCSQQTQPMRSGQFSVCVCVCVWVGAGGWVSKQGGNVGKGENMTEEDG